MFERFTDRARRVVVLAQEEARLLNHNYIGTEHILLGLIHEQEGVAARVLEELGISLDAVRVKVESIIGEGDDAPSGHIPFTPRAKKVLELSLREALQLGHNYIGTEHILLGLIREGEGVGAEVLINLGADLSIVRDAVIQQMSGSRRRPSARVTSPGFEPPRLTPAAARASVEARRLAAGRAVGSHHYLLALLGQENSMAANALAAQGVTRSTVEEHLSDKSAAGTSDETPEEAGARRIRMRVRGQVLTLEIDDAELAASLEKAMVGRKARIIAGTDPDAEAAGFPNVWSAVSRSVDDLTRRLGRVTGSRTSVRTAAPEGEWRPPGWHEGGHVAVYWVVSSAGSKVAHLQCSETDPGPVRAWLRDWLTANRPQMAAGNPEGETDCCALWAYVDRAGESFSMASYGFGRHGPPGCEAVGLDALVDHALADLGQGGPAAASAAAES